MYIIPIRNVKNSVSLAASEEISTFGIDNLRKPLGSSRWRSVGLTPYIIGRFDTAQIVKFWGLWYTNAKIGDQARLRLADTEGNLITSPIFDSTYVNIWPPGSDLSSWAYVHQRQLIDSLYHIPSEWFRIDLDFSGNSDGYVDVGIVCVDSIFRPVVGHSPGWQYSPITRGAFSNITGSGGELRGQGTLKRPTSFEFTSLTDEEFFTLDEFFRTTNGNISPWGVVLNELDLSHSMNFTFYGYPTMETTPTMDRYIARVSIQEP